jgi:hypothetical protein
MVLSNSTRLDNISLQRLHLPCLEEYVVEDDDSEDDITSTFDHCTIPEI